MFDFIAAIDKRDEDKCTALYNLIASNTEHVMALTPTGGGYAGAMTRYCDIPNVITAKWCKEFADEAKEITGLEICRVEAYKGNKKAVYHVNKNCLRIYEGYGFTWTAIYENNNGIICRDQAALACEC